MSLSPVVSEINLKIANLKKNPLRVGSPWNFVPRLVLKSYKDAATSRSETFDDLHCTLSLAALCIVIGPVCVFATGGRGLFVCESVTMIIRNCVHRFSPNWVCG